MHFSIGLTIPFGCAHILFGGYPPSGTLSFNFRNWFFVFLSKNVVEPFKFSIVELIDREIDANRTERVFFSKRILWLYESVNRRLHNVFQTSDGLCSGYFDRGDSKKSKCQMQRTIEKRWATRQHDEKWARHHGPHFFVFIYRSGVCELDRPILKRKNNPCFFSFQSDCGLFS